MAVTVDNIELVAEEGSRLGQEGQEFISKLSDDVRNRLHITVGTKNGDVKPVEAKFLVERWRTGEKYGIFVEELEGVVVKGRIKGLFH
jgi:tRNA ligase